jgi:hypothetical protein
LNVEITRKEKEKKISRNRFVNKERKR